MAYFQKWFFQKIFQKKVLVIWKFWQQFSYITWWFWTRFHGQNHDLRPGTRKSLKNCSSTEISMELFGVSQWKGKENRPLVGVGFDPFCRFSCYGPKIEKIKLEPVRGCSEECFSTPGRSHTPSLYLAKNRFLKFSPSPKYSLTEAFIQCSKVNSRQNAYKSKNRKTFLAIIDLSEFWW